MTANVITVKKDVILTEAIALLLRWHISALPVVDDENKAARSRGARGQATPPRPGNSHHQGQNSQDPQQQKQPATNAQTAGLPGLHFVQESQITEFLFLDLLPAEKMNDHRQGGGQSSKKQRWIDKTDRHQYIRRLFCRYRPRPLSKGVSVVICTRSIFCRRHSLRRFFRQARNLSW